LLVQKQQNNQLMFLEFPKSSHWT